MSSYETAVVRVQEVAAKVAPGMRLRVQPPYGNSADYVGALAASAEEYLKRDYDYLLFSFHGIPERQIRKSDPTGGHCLARPDCCEAASPAQATCYRAQCFQTGNGSVLSIDNWISWMVGFAWLWPGNYGWNMKERSIT